MAKPSPAPMEFRTIDGAGNNLAHPLENAAGQPLDRIGSAHFVDGVSVPIETVDPRAISNGVVGQGDPEVPNKQGLSGFMYAFGQFVDHDLDRVDSDGVHHMDIHVGAGDPTFPDGTVIPLTRAVVAPGTGEGTTHPGTAVDSITGWLDLSQVYGSDPVTAASLKASDGAHLATSAGNDLPIGPSGMFQAGDVRVAENPDLSALHTLFMREHNFQVDQLHTEHPELTSAQLYDQARAITSAEYAHIVYDEFLPHLLGKGAIKDFHGYNPDAHATLSEEFTGAAFRFGHSIVSDEIAGVDNKGVEIKASALKDAFFVPPAVFDEFGGAGALLRHLYDDTAPTMDARIVDGLREFLADPPAALDLAATNIQRGHDLGLGTLNETRTALGLHPYTDFNQITNDKQTVDAMKTVFGDINKVDLWTGGLAEKATGGGIVGQTFHDIIAKEFTDLRDGDRFFYENALDKHTVKMVNSTTLGDLMLRDTDTTKAFVKPHTDVFESKNPAPADHGHHPTVDMSQGDSHSVQAVPDHTHHFDLMA